MIIELLEDKTQAPFGLLYDADPSREAVADYLERGACYVGKLNGRTIGEYVLLPTRPFTAELANVAVAEEFQGRGYGKQLVLDAIERARSLGYMTLEIGTGISGALQIGLYEKCGFRTTHLDIDFFRRHYPEPVIDNGVELRHMVRMSMDLHIK